MWVQSYVNPWYSRQIDNTGIGSRLTTNVSDQVSGHHFVESTTRRKSTSCRQYVAFKIILQTILPSFSDEVGTLILFDTSLNSDAPRHVLALAFDCGGVSEICWLNSNIFAVGTTRGRIVTFSIQNEFVSLIILHWSDHSRYFRTIWLSSPMSKPMAMGWHR